MATEWFYTQNGQQAPAPVSAAELKRLATAGDLQPTDMVWREGMPNWVTAGTIKELFPASRITTAPAPAEKNVTPRPGSQPALGEAPAARPSEKPAGGGLADLHPVLVLLLSICSFGLFGLYYSFKVCLDYSASTARRRADSAGRPLGRARHPLWVLLWAYLTGGYYFYYWVYAVMRECRAYAGPKDLNPRTELSLMLLFPPYAIYAAVFRLPGMIRRTQSLAGIPDSAAVGHAHVFLNPCLCCGLPFLAMVYQDALNQVWFTAP
jgi:hypothetical protein